jgi:hypothetical protein
LGFIIEYLEEGCYHISIDLRPSKIAALTLKGEEVSDTHPEQYPYLHVLVGTETGPYDSNNCSKGLK